MKMLAKEKKMTCTALLLSLSLLVLIGAFAVQIPAAEENKKSQTISRAGSQSSLKGPAEYFTGNVRIDPLFPANDSSPFSGAYVTFEPGARSAWHIHPTGQHLTVTAGVGRTQEWGGPIEESEPYITSERWALRQALCSSGFERAI